MRRSSVGTSRQPSTSCPSATTIRSSSAVSSARSPSSVGRKHISDAVAPARRQLERDRLAQELVRHLQQEAGAVAGLGVGAGGAAVLEVGERLDPESHDVVGRTVVQARDDGHATGVVLVARVVQAIGLLGLANPGHR